MDQKFVEKTILVVPLDWGLGHTARCVPIIQHLQSYHFNVIVAAEGAVKTMLKQEFPQLEMLPLPGYNIRYSKNKNRFAWKMLLQLPAIVYAIYKEHQWLKKVARQRTIDAVISDNRFGLYHVSIPSVYITHQLFIQTGNRFTSWIAERIHRLFIDRYQHCWVPDFEGVPNAAGALSHPKRIPAHVQYLGCISRFQQMSVERKYDLLIVLSGPEPQRTMLEDLILQQLTNGHGHTLLVRGLPGAELPQLRKDLPNLAIENHLPGNELNLAIQQSKMVISRSGYTTVMDLLKLQHPAIFIPTPGQAEQEYLGKYLAEQGLFYTTTQEGFSLDAALKAAAIFPYQFPQLDMERYKKVIHQFVETL